MSDLQTANLVDAQLGGGSKSGYAFAVVEQAGSGGTAVFGAYAFPSITTGVSQTGMRRFGVTETGVMTGDADLTTKPTTRALISGMGYLGN
jgi:hypothetical protein